MSGADRQFLLSVFLMEAWDTLATIEKRLATPTTEEALEDLRLVTHRLRGSAALNGFPRVSALGTLMEQVVEQMADPTAATHPDARAALAELLATLQQALEAIGSSGVEDRAVIDEAIVRHTKLATARSAHAPAAAATSAVAEMDIWLRSNAEVLEYFLPEAAEHLDVAGQALLELERAGASEAQLARLFRALHTLKGAAYTVGCRVVGTLAHRIEDLLGEVREGHRPLSERVIETMNAGVDALRLLVASVASAPEGREVAYESAVRRLDAAMAPASEVEPVATEPAPEVEPVATAPAPSTVDEAPAEAVPAIDPEPSAGAPGGLEAVGPTIEPAPRTAIAAGPSPRTLAPTDKAVRTSIRVNLDRLDALLNLVGELVIARGRLERHLDQLDTVAGLLVFTQARMRNTVGEFESKYADPQVAAAGPPAEPTRNGNAELTPPLDEVFGALEFDRYDDFNILARRITEIAGDIGEVQAQVAALVRTVREDAGRVQQLGSALRAEVTHARMVPMSRLFARFARQVRETARTAGKRVTLEMAGDAVEVDNAVIDQATDPLLHLVQNAVVHGIEPDDERRAAGKPGHGTIRITAAQKGGTLHVEVADDGRGIDFEAVRAAALRGGFANAATLQQLGERDLLDLIFLPGFSTAESVTTAAGRGVGMDVVRTNVGRLGGEIDVATTPGVGTRVTLKLPLTVAISDALLVRAAGEVLAIPVPAIKAMVRVRPEAIDASPDGEVVDVGGECADVVRLDRVLGLGASAPRDWVFIVALRTGRRVVALVVDELLGKKEIVVKRLGAFLDGVGPFSAATVSSEGRVILLLDPVRLAERRVAVAPALPRAAGPATGDGRAAGRTVLLVDDSVSVRKFVGQMLERAGFTVVTANDGVEALERVADLEADVIVTDLEMPRLNGYELIRDLRRRPATREVPIAVLTTRAGEKHVHLAQQLGVEHYVTKPVDEKAFVRLIELLAAAPAGMTA